MQVRQPANTFTHLFGVVLSFIGMYFIVSKSVSTNITIQIISSVVFSIGLISLYSASTVYHWTNASDKVIATLRKVDHIMIYILIASTYTPICLVAIKGWAGYTLFGVIWGLTLVGIILKIFWSSAPRILYTSFYLGLGWGAVFTVYPLSKIVPLESLMLLLIGGISYSVGAVIYALKSKKVFFKVLGFHEIFHLFILLGSISHYWFIYSYIIG